MTTLKARDSQDHQKYLESSRDCPLAFSQLDFSRKQRLNRMKSITKINKNLKKSAQSFSTLSRSQFLNV